MNRFPSDPALEQMVQFMPERMIDFMLQMTGHYEARLNLARLVVQMRGHAVTRDNIEYLPQGQEMKCDRCGMKISIPMKPEPGKPGIFGRAAELNCPAVRKQGDPSNPSDMPLTMFDNLLLLLGVEHPPNAKEQLDEEKKRQLEAEDRLRHDENLRRLLYHR